MGVERIDYIEYKLVSQLGEGGGVVEFIVKPQMTNAYIDLKNSRLHLKFKITHNANKGIKVAVAPINNFLHSVFSQVELTLNQQVISPEISTSYAYKSYLDTLLNEGHVMTNSHQKTAQMFYLDSSDKMDNTNVDPKHPFNAGMVIS